MGTYRNNCEGSNGATVTTSDGATDHFAAVIGTPIFDTSQFAHGTSAIKYNTTISAQQYVRLTDTVAQTHQSGSFYLRLSAAPPSTSFVVAQDGSSAASFKVQILANRTIRATNAATGTLGTTTNAVPVNQWVRIDYECDTNGTWSVDLFLTADSATPTESLSGTGASLGTDMRRAAFGLSVSAANFPDLWVDDVYVSHTAGKRGPSLATIAPSGLASSVAFGIPALSLTISPTGIASSVAFGTPAVGLHVAPSGLPSSLAFGTPRITEYLLPAGLPSSAAFGTPAVGLVLAPTGIASSVAFGTPAVGLHIAPAGLPSSVTFGAPAVLSVARAGSLTSTAALAGFTSTAQLAAFAQAAPSPAGRFTTSGAS